MARGLAAAHEKGLVHRDLKPDNVFLTGDGQVKLLDFGLARHATEAHPAQATRSAITDAGTVMGTVGYMAPEQVRGEVVDARADLFALGAVLYEMLTGERAFRRNTNAETMTAILNEDPPDVPAVRAITPALDRIVRHCLEKRPAERFQTARDVAFALDALSAATIDEGTRLAWYDRRGQSQGRLGEDGDYTNLEISPDRTRLLVSLPDQQARTRDIWILDLRRGVPTRATFDRQDERSAAWSPDGQSIVYRKGVDVALHREHRQLAVPAEGRAVGIAQEW